MTTLTRRRISYNWLGLLVVLIAVALCFLFVLPAALASNVAFFSKSISTLPAQVMVYYDGETYIYQQGDTEYDQIVEVAYDILGEERGIQDGFGWSDSRFEQARSDGNAVEFIYAEPVKLPGRRVDAAAPVRLMFPLNVFGHSGEMVLRGGQEDYWGAPIRVPSLDPLRETVDNIIVG